MSVYRAKPRAIRWNAGHPLARGGVAFFGFGGYGGVTNAVTGTRYSASGAWSSSLRGPVFTFSTKTTITGLNLDMSKPWSMLVASRETTTGNAAVSIQPTSGHRRWEFRRASSSTVYEQFAGITPDEAITNQTVSGLGFGTTIAVVIPGVSVSVYANGAMLSMTTGITVDTGFSALYLGGYDSGNNTTSAIDCVYLAQTAWTTNEVSRLSVDPFAPVRPGQLSPAILAAASPTGGLLLRRRRHWRAA